MAGKDEEESFMSLEDDVVKPSSKKASKKSNKAVRTTVVENLKF